ncbi:MAG: hypothetical protein SF172_00995 [Burkholderiales bacterium]|nr:hypothetical protein [Burkholderiales bacterium]
MAQHAFEMALTRAEFLRLLPAAVQCAIEESAGEIRGESASVSWRITLVELEPRRIALLSLPRLNVTLRIDAASDAVANEWLRRFQLGYQRAGG